MTVRSGNILYLIGNLAILERWIHDTMCPMDLHELQPGMGSGDQIFERVSPFDYCEFVSDGEAGHKRARGNGRTCSELGAYSERFLQR